MTATTGVGAATESDSGADVEVEFVGLDNVEDDVEAAVDVVVVEVVGDASWLVVEADSPCADVPSCEQPDKTTSSMAAVQTRAR